MGIYKRNGEMGRGRREKWVDEGGTKCKEAKVKYGGMVATNGDGKGAVIVE